MPEPDPAQGQQVIIGVDVDQHRLMPCMAQKLGPASSLRKIPFRQASSQNTRSTWKTRRKASARQEQQRGPEHDQHLGHGRLVPPKMLCLDLHGISTPI